MTLDVHTIALLRPSNAAAQLNFSAIADALLHSQPADVHHRRYIHIDSHRLHLRDPALSVPSDSDVEDKVESPLIWTGHYVFSLDNPPLRPSSGWALGFGQRARDADTGLVDLLLADSYGIRDSFAHFNFDVDGVFAIVPRHTGMQIAGTPVRKHLRYTLSNPTELRFGACDYHLEFVGHIREAELEYQDNKNIYLRQVEIAQHNPHQASSATPTPFNEEIKGNWSIRAITGKTLQSVVKCAIRKTRTETAACKTLARTAVTVARIKREIQTYQTIDEQLRMLGPDGIGRKFVRHIADVHYSSGEQEWQKGRDDEVTIFWVPFAHRSLADFCGRKVHNKDASDSEKQTWFAQLLLGLRDLASIGFAHRDIKPGNIMIVHRSHGERHVSIIDLESAIAVPDGGLDPVPGTWGTKQYLAPEAENTAYSERYSTQVDVFSAGNVGYELFIGETPWRVRETNPFRWFHPQSGKQAALEDGNRATRESSRAAVALFETAMTELAAYPFNSVQNLLLQMLRVVSRGRITAAEALEHPFLRSTRREIEEEIRGYPGDKRQRSGE